MHQTKLKSPKTRKCVNFRVPGSLLSIYTQKTNQTKQNPKPNWNEAVRRERWKTTWTENFLYFTGWGLWDSLSGRPKGMELPHLAAAEALLRALWLQCRLEQNIDLEIYCRWVFRGTNVHHHWWDMPGNKFCQSWNLVPCIAVWEHEQSSWQCALIFNHDREQGPWHFVVTQLFFFFSSSVCILNSLAAAKNG